MQGLDNLKTRLSYYGTDQVDRMNKDKARTLKKVFLAAYQRATAILSDGREFYCLMNPDKLTENNNDNIISIPFDDICLNKERLGKTSQHTEIIGMKPGDVYQWKETNTYWLVFLRDIQETAYFKATVRRCDYEVYVGEENHYHVYVRGPEEKSIDWSKMENAVYNNLNYKIVMSITKDEITSAFFKRLAEIKVNGRNWQVQATDDMSKEGIIDVYLDEYYTNSIKERQEEYEKNNAEAAAVSKIIGDTVVYPYDIKEYSISELSGGTWLVDSKKVRILNQTDTKCKVEIITGKSGNFNLIYRLENEDIVLPITIESL